MVEVAEDAWIIAVGARRGLIWVGDTCLFAGSVSGKLASFH